MADPWQPGRYFLLVVFLIIISVDGRKIVQLFSDVDDNARLRLTADDFYKLRPHPSDVAGSRGVVAEDETEAPHSPDSMPLITVALKSKDIMNNIADGNRYSGVEPFEGDIVLDEPDKKLIEGSSGVGRAGKKRNVNRDRRKLWITKVVPYVIEQSRVDATKDIRSSMDAIEAISCLKFVAKKPTDKNWLRIYLGIGCFSDIGRKYYQKGSTDVSLGKSCIKPPLIQHELMHALGFFHEQSRSDRDSFVKINYENIKQASKQEFQIYDSYEADLLDTSYDYHSLMQYGNKAFSANGKETMNSIFDVNLQLGAKELSKQDIIRLNKVYNCKSKTKGWSDWSDWSPCMKPKDVPGAKCMRSRDRFCFSADQTKCKGVDDYGVETQREDCEMKKCEAPLDGHWGTWSAWTTCTKTCDEGTHTRTRKCDNPTAKNGGKPCKDKNSDTKPCKIKACQSNWYDANFEDGWGMWQQGKADNFDWTRQTGGTPTKRTGPNGDHTMGTGYYAYVEGSPPRVPGEIARLVSAEFTKNPIVECATFYYMMKGRDVGYLDLHIKTKSGRFINLWRKNGHQGPDWYNAAVNVPVLEEPFTMIIEAKIGNGELSDIAIDDFYFDDGECPASTQGCEDHNPSCGDWAANGECKKNFRWMRESCCKTCRALGSCEDNPEKGIKKVKCREWAMEDQCIQNKDWMWLNCCYSCQSCFDSSPQCSNWASQGDCNSNKFWMTNNCKTSCNICKATLT